MNAESIQPVAMAYCVAYVALLYSFGTSVQSTTGDAEIFDFTSRRVCLIYPTGGALLSYDWTSAYDSNDVKTFIVMTTGFYRVAFTDLQFLSQLSVMPCFTAFNYK